MYKMNAKLVSGSCSIEQKNFADGAKKMYGRGSYMCYDGDSKPGAVCGGGGVREWIGDVGAIRIDGRWWGGQIRRQRGLQCLRTQRMRPSALAVGLGSRGDGRARRGRLRTWGDGSTVLLVRQAA